MREIMIMTCERCGREFDCVKGSLAGREHTCNVCAGVPALLRGPDDPARPVLGWPRDTPQRAETPRVVDTGGQP